jgi:hypothetical protein
VAVPSEPDKNFARREEEKKRTQAVRASLTE